MINVIYYTSIIYLDDDVVLYLWIMKYYVFKNVNCDTLNHNRVSVRIKDASKIFISGKFSLVLCLFCSLAVFISSTEPLRLPRRRGLLEFRGRDVQFLRQWQRRLSLQRGRFGKWRRHAGDGQTLRRPRRDRTGLWTQAPSNRLHSRPADHTITPALAAFNVLKSVLYIFVFPPSLSTNACHFFLLFGF